MSRASSLLCLVLFIGCGGGASSGVGPLGPVGSGITLGMVITESGGGSATIGHLIVEAAELAVDEINAQGGIDGTPITIDVRNDRQDPAEAANAAAALIAERGVPAIFGAAISSATLAAAQVTIPAGVVLMSSSSTAPEISDLDDHDLVFRTAPPDTRQGSLLAELAVEHGLSRMAVMHEPGAYGAGIAAAFSQSFTARGGIVTSVVALEPGAGNYTDLLAGVYDTAPDGILAAAFTTESAELIRDYVLSFPYRQTFWLFPDSAEDQSFITATGPSEFTFRHEGTAPGMSTASALDTFQQAFKDRFGEDPLQAVRMYDAVYLVALALVDAGGVATGEAIRDHLRPVANAPGMVFGPGEFGAAAAAIRAGVKINYEGASGPLDFDAHGDPLASYDLWVVRGGAILVVQRGVYPEGP